MKTFSSESSYGVHLFPKVSSWLLFLWQSRVGVLVTVSEKVLFNMILNYIILFDIVLKSSGYNNDLQLHTRALPWGCHEIHYAHNTTSIFHKTEKVFAAATNNFETTTCWCKLRHANDVDDSLIEDDVDISRVSSTGRSIKRRIQCYVSNDSNHNRFYECNPIKWFRYC